MKIFTAKNYTGHYDKIQKHIIKFSCFESITIAGTKELGKVK